MKIETLVLSGGGMRGVTYCGIFKRLTELNVEKKIELSIKTIYAVSVGTFFGLIYLLKYTCDELEKEILLKNFSHLKSININGLFDKYGIDSGINIITWLETLMIKKGFSRYLTFKDFYDVTNVTFNVCATNLNTYTLQIFNHNNVPDMPVLQAIRMSMSLPFIFSSESFNGDIYVDGAVITNYPIDFVDKNDLPNTLGINIIETLPKKDIKIESLHSFMFNVMACTFLNRDTLKRNLYNENTIFITAYENDTVNFKMSHNRKKNIMLNGYKMTDAYFKFKTEKKNERIN